MPCKYFEHATLLDIRSRRIVPSLRYEKVNEEEVVVANVDEEVPDK